MIEARAAEVGAPLLLHGRDWERAADGDGLVVETPARRLELPRPALAGRAPDRQCRPRRGGGPAARRGRARRPRRSAAACGTARWPARLQRLAARAAGRAAARRAPRVWLDGGHNPAAGQVLADSLPGLLRGPRRCTSWSACCRPRISPSSWRRCCRWPRACASCRSPGEALEPRPGGLGRDRGATGRARRGGGLGRGRGRGDRRGRERRPTTS